MSRGALVLCGGRSRRMGRDKASLPFGQETLLQRVVRILEAIVPEVVVVGRPGQTLPHLPGRIRVARDDEPDLGPLAGLDAGLKLVQADTVYATACDAPFLQPAFVELLFDALDGKDIAVAEAEGFTHPLAGVYRKAVGPTVTRLLAEGQRRPVVLFDTVPTVRVTEDKLRAADPQLVSLMNCNDVLAYEAALQRLWSEGTT